MSTRGKSRKSRTSRMTVSKRRASPAPAPSPPPAVTASESAQGQLFRDPNPDGTFWAEKVERVKVFDGVTKYYVKWYDLSKDENTWEPASHLKAEMLLDALDLDIEPQDLAPNPKKAKTK